MAFDVQDLFRRHSEELRRFLRRRGASPDSAADLTQEAFLRLLSLGPNAPIANPQAYLFRTAGNLSIDHARRRRALRFVDDGEEALGRLADDAPSPERVVLSRQELAILQEALSRTPETPRNVFLARLEGKTFEEIGRSLNIPPQTAFSQMARVMMRLKAALDRARV
ncbi:MULTISPECIES: RNA polymerase sigma factor [Methylosinus]|uniref:RNA polymerase sigma factor n=1 Tax=Methylosinus trichosporium (strain ATCC 35070 / NCIMB 11131 / UNIQEM 75 / OB3b) TaxID=595536 RepID=A0A2D2D6Q2_METT3|nr:MULTISPECIES: RNA polymerase sigma factor [Methylosinus]ATQ70632.1 RNA polymerase sigma factor [Methylosinus trichosporium OB3b]OBS50746.1 fec I [Methylosinus sp. 3S-1]